jgi:hypothetical protein
MKITTIKYMERKNLGNYEHKEITAEAILEEGENTLAAMVNLRFFVQDALEGSVYKVEESPVTHDEETKTNLPVEEVKEKKKRAKKEKVPSVIDPSELPPVEPEGFISKPAKEKLVAYNSAIAEHKSIFGGYLNKKYENSWKTSNPADEIKSFTASLNGKDFLDNDGKIVESFLNLVHGFFG